MTNQKTNYSAKDIVILEGLEPVRLRPGMYIGSVGSKGVNHLLYEIIDNSIDEHLAGFCNKITVSINRDGSAVVEDNGRGIPVDRHEKGITAERIILTTLHAGGKFNNKLYEVSGGLHGVGASVVNALSRKLEVDVYGNGFTYHDEYEKGRPVVELIDGLLPKTEGTRKRGTKITFWPDEEIFKENTFKTSSIKERLKELAYLNPKLTIVFNNNKDGEKQEIYHESEGLSSFLKYLNTNKQPVTDVIQFEGKFEGITLNAAIQYTNSFDELILSFCNNINTVEGGTHVSGFKNKLTLLINSYARELGILKEKDENYNGTDVRCGLTCIISIKHPNPLFEGQVKSKLGSIDAAKAVSQITGEQLQLFLDKNVEQLKSIIQNAEKSAKLRRENTKNKANLIEKPKFSFEGNGKLANCESKDASISEIFIVEGDSAGGNARLARNRKIQAIIPIRGKILNVEKASMDKILKNEEIKSIINALGCGVGEGYGNNFNIDKLKYNKIIIMSDADVDGSHISALLLTFFYRFMPELVISGHIYRAMPPLYKVVNKNTIKYFYNDKDLNKYMSTHKKCTIQRYKGLGEMDATQLWETTMDPAARKLKKIEIEDVVKANKTTELLMGNDIEGRRDFIYKNALDANLDL